MTVVKPSGPAAVTGGLFMKALILLLAAAILGAGPGVPARAETDAPLVKKLTIKGNKLIETETIRSRLLSVEGSTFAPERLSEDIRSLYKLGYFDDIQVESEPFEGGLALTFVLKEKPLVTRVEFKGNKEVKTDDLKSKVEIKTNTVVNENEIRLGAERLTAFLHEKGFYRGKVDYRLESTSSDEMTLVYLIDEGEKLYVRDIRILGNEALSDDDIKEVMKTKEKGFFSFFTDSGTLLAQQLEEDVLRIVAFLYNNGYLKARVEDPKIEVDREKRSITITIALHEGIRYKVGRIEAPGDDLYNADKILARMKTRTGQVFQRDVFARDLNDVTGMYTELGYAYCRVDAMTDFDDPAMTVNLRLVVDRGPKVRIGRIHITGNTLTRDNVIRREMYLREGEYFSSRNLAKSRQRILNLGYFDKVEVTTDPRERDVIDINVQVTERLTGLLSFGLGYSSENKFGIVFKLTEENLFGRGYKTQAAIDYASSRQEYSISFFNPAVWDSAFSMGFKVYNQTTDYSQYDRKALGGSLTFGHTLGEYTKGYLTLKNETVNITNVEEGASNIILEQAGKTVTHSTALRLTRDSKDNFFYPTSGSVLTWRSEYAGGFLGGDNWFHKHEAEATFFFPIYKLLVLSLHGEGGVVRGLSGHNVNITERFFMGGIDSVRGFPVRAIGPKDENGDPTGGFTRAIGTVEIIFPILEEQRMSGVFFFDAGQAWDLGEKVDFGTLRTSAGAGIRWFSPIGPFRIEWGFNLAPKPGESRSDWQFSIGTLF